MGEVDRAALSARVAEAWEAAGAAGSPREAADGYDAVVAAMRAYWTAVPVDDAVGIAFAVAVNKVEDRAATYRRLATEQEGRSRG